MNNRNRLNLLISVALIAALLFSLLAVFASSSALETSKKIGVSARAATLYSPESGEFIYSKNAEQRLPMASTTKLMTALVAAESVLPEDTVRVADEAIGTEGSSAYLKAGDVLTVEELLYALLLQSANDAAVALAYYVSGGVEEFAELMNGKAAELGLEDTSFENPHGLDGENHYTTAHDLAIIGAEVLQNEYLRAITSTYKKTFATEDRRRTYVNHNKLLKLYDGCVGMKTGFTKKSGRCLVGAAERDGVTLVSVTLDAPGDWSDHKAMLDYGFDTLERVFLAEAGEFRYTLPVIGGESESLTVSNSRVAYKVVRRGEHDIKETVSLTKFAVAPVSKGDVLGKVKFSIDGKVVEEIELTAEENVSKKKSAGLFDRLISIFT